MYECAFTAPPSIPPKPVRTFRDAATGVTVHQITDAPEQSGPLYFTRPSWTPDGKHFVYVGERERSANYYAIGPDGETRQLTHLPPPAPDHRFTAHMHRQFRAEEGDRIMLRIPAVHPSRPLLVYAWRNELRLVDVERGTDEPLAPMPPGESEMPFTGGHTVFTADGRDLIVVTTRHARPGENLDLPGMVQDKSLRDESGFVSKIWRFDFERRRFAPQPIFASNGEQSHVLTCPWDSDLILWVNYGHGCLYTIRRDGTGLREIYRESDIQPNHYSWDVANRRLVCNLSDMKNAWRTRIASIDIDTGAVHRFQCATLPHPSHATVSPDGRYVALDVHDRQVDGTQGIHLLDQREDAVHPLCRSTWGALTDDAGKPVKSEYLHPNPNFSPDGRWLVFGTDFGTKVAQVYVVDLSTWSPRR